MRCKVRLLFRRDQWLGGNGGERFAIPILLLLSLRNASYWRVDQDRHVHRLSQRLWVVPGALFRGDRLDDQGKGMVLAR